MMYRDKKILETYTNLSLEAGIPDNLIKKSYVRKGHVIIETEDKIFKRKISL